MRDGALGARSDRDRVAEGVVAPLTEQLALVDASRLRLVERHLHVHVLRLQLRADDVVDVVVVVAVHVDHDGVLRARDERGEHAVNVVARREERPRVRRVPVEEALLGLELLELVPVERDGLECFRDGLDCFGLRRAHVSTLRPRPDWCKTPDRSWRYGARVNASLRDPVRGPLRSVSDRLSGQTKKAVRRVLPGWAWYAYMRSSGYLPTPIDAGPLERIERENPERLLDAGYLADELLPSMGLNGTSPHLFPERLGPYLGRGTHHFQLPIQFGPYLAEAGHPGASPQPQICVADGGAVALTTQGKGRPPPPRTGRAVELSPT